MRRFQTWGLGRYTLVLFTSGVLLCGGSGSKAQTNGVTGPVKIIVPFTPGTTPDSVSRLIAPRLARSLGQSVVTENRVGASGMIGMDAVAKAAPDGQTLMITTNTTLALPYFYKKVPFEVVQSFQPLGLIGSANFALVVHPSVPANNLKELVGYLQARPGTVDYASPGIGTLHHLAMERIANAAGIKINHVPYKGTAGAITDVIGGHVKMMIMPLHIAMPLRADGKLKVIGSTRAQRDSFFPEIVPLQEAGILSLDEHAWVAVWGPKGMAPGIVSLYSNAIKDALENSEVKASMAQQGMSLSTATPEEVRNMAVAEYEKWGRVARDSKIQAE